tara:strand:+ start:618 stop:932 length:315 start_codon:yes stop_codon:yes gene_type:complete
MKNKFSGYWVLLFVFVIILILQTSCTTTPIVVEEQTNTEQTEKQSKKLTNPILCALLLRSLDCSVKEKDNAKVEYEAETHPVPVEDPVLELLIDLGEVEPDASN